MCASICVSGRADSKRAGAGAAAARSEPDFPVRAELARAMFSPWIFGFQRTVRPARSADSPGKGLGPAGMNVRRPKLHLPGADQMRLESTCPMRLRETGWTA